MPTEVLEIIFTKLRVFLGLVQILQSGNQKFKLDSKFGKLGTGEIEIKSYIGGIAVDQNGNILVSETGNNRIQVLDCGMGHVISTCHLHYDSVILRMPTFCKHNLKLRKWASN